MSSDESLRGLTSSEVKERVKRGQTNAYQARTSRTYRQILIDNLFNIFNITIALLLAILVLLGEIGDSVFAGATVVANTLIGLFQEIRAKRALDRLAKLSAGTVRVRRDTQTIDIHVDDVVQDDLIEVVPGDKIVVDGPCVWQDSVEVDESLITGESDSIDKDIGEMFTSGSFVTAGRAIMRAEKVGADSFVNKLGETASGFKFSLTPIQQKINAIVIISVVIMALFGPLLIVGGLARGDPLVDTMRNAVVLVTSFVPQGLVLATTIALSFGALRIGLQQTLVQRINAVESMGNITILCFDKTGTLTQNRLSVIDLFPLGRYAKQDSEVNRMLATYVGSLSTQNNTAGAIGAYVGGVEDGPVKVSEVAFTSARKWGASTFDDGQTLILGAPEMLVEDAAVREQASKLARQGLRVLSFVASTSPPLDAQLPAQREPVALIVLQDKLRADIHETLDEFTSHGIQLKVISGDNLETVAAIAKEARMGDGSGISGPELDAMSDDAFKETVKATKVFARISPETKRRIIATLTADGEYVAMVGDGVNDVPALKTARIGIAMYDGAQIAKDVADLVLLNNALSTLPKALHEGYATTQKIYATAKMFLTRNMYMILLFIMVGFMGLPFPGQVRLLSWAAISTSGIPSTLVAFGLIQPRSIWKFQRQVLGYIIVSGLIGAVALATSYTVAYLTSGRDLLLARSVMSMMATIYGILIFWDVHGVIPFEPVTFKQNAREAIVGVGVAIIALAVPLVFWRLFETVVIPWRYWAFLGGVTLVSAFLLWRSTLEQTRLLNPIRALLRR